MLWLHSYWYLCLLEKVIVNSQHFSGSSTGVETGTLTCFKHINEITNVFRMNERLKKHAELV